MKSFVVILETGDLLFEGIPFFNDFLQVPKLIKVCNVNVARAGRYLRTWSGPGTSGSRLEVECETSGQQCFLSRNQTLAV